MGAVSKAEISAASNGGFISEDRNECGRRVEDFLKDLNSWSRENLNPVLGFDRDFKV
jgi:hypothetical protein